MTRIEKRQLAELVLELENLLTILNPEVQFNALSATSLDQIDYSTIDIKTVHELAKIIRLNVRYARFDLEACRRELAGLLQIINGNVNDGQ